MSSQYESIDTHLAAEVVEFAIGLIEHGKTDRGLDLLRNLHERLLQDDAVHYRSCLAEVGGAYVVCQ